MERSPFLKTYVAVALLAGLGAYAYFVAAKKPSSDQKPKEKVFALERSKAREVRLTSAGGTTRAVKDGSHWRLTEPSEAPADTDAIDGILSTLESLEIEGIAQETPVALKDYGLDPPRLSLQVALEGQKEPVALLLGDSVPAEGGVFAKVPATPRIFTLASHVEGSLNKKPFDLRDRAVLHVKRDDVRSLEIQGPEGSYALARDEKGEWAFTKPVATRAGRWSVDGLVGNLESLRMDAIAAENAQDLKLFGLDKPTRTVSLGLADGTTKKLEIGGAPKDKPKAYHAREASSRLVAVIPGALVEDLAKGPKELRAKRLLEVATYEVEGFDVEGDGTKAVFARSTTKDKEGIDVPKWKKTAPDVKDVETNKIQDALFAVGGVEAQEFIDAPKPASAYGLDKPRLKVVLRFAGGKPEAWFEMGEKDGSYFARRIGDGAILKLDAAKAQNVVQSFKGL